MPNDVLDRDRSFIDEDADRERQTAERHDVEGFAYRPKHHNRAEHGKRNRNRDDQRRAPASEEQQDHHAGQQGRDNSFIGHAGDGAADEYRLVADEADPERIGKLVLDVDDLLLDAGNDIQRRDRPGLENHHQNRTVAVDVDNIGLRRVAVAHARDIPDVNHRALNRLDLQVPKLFHPPRRVIELDVVFQIADLLRADRRDQVLRRKRVGYILSWQP